MKKRISLFLVFTMLVTLLVPLAVTTVSADEPTLITDQASFVSAIATNSVKDADGKATGTFKLANDITISGEWNFTTIFRGELDGDGHTITFADGATITGGLFKMVSANAYIHDLQIAQAGAATWVPQQADGCANYCLGGVVGLAGAGYVNGVKSWGGDNPGYVANAANKVRFKNVTVTVNMNVTGSSPNASVGGIVGEVGIYTEVTNCTFNGSISDTNRYDGGNKETYCQSMVAETVRSAYGGMVGVGFRKTVLVISKCTNNGNITGYGQQGGILGTLTNAWDDIFNAITIQRCINNGTITCNGTTDKCNAGGIAGFVFVKTGATATVSNCINNGEIVKADGDARAAGIVGDLRRGADNAFQIIGCLQECDSFAGSQIAHEHHGHGTVLYTNNYGCGAGDSTYRPLSDAASYEAAYATLNAAYPGVYVYEEGKIKLAEGSSSLDPSSMDVPKALTLDVTVPEPTGTAITNQKELEAMKANGTYYLANDIEIKGSFRSLSDFSGVLHGNGHAVVLNGAELRGGFFKSLAGGKVYNLSFTEAPGSSDKNICRGLLSANESDLCFGTVAGYGYGTLVGVTANCAIGSSLINTANAYVGGLIGILTDGNTVIYNCRNTGKVQGAFAGGIVGSTSCENGKMEISRCVNWGEVTSSSGAAGGIIAIHSVSSVQVSMSMLALENVNYGAVSTTESRYCGGIAGSVGSFLAGKASFLRNVNYGTATANATIPCGVIGYVGYNGILIAGNVNLGNVLGSNEPNRLIAEIESNEGIATENNFAAAGTAPATAGEILGTAIDENTLATLNAAYPDAFAAGAEGKIALQWATGLSATAPEVTYTLPAANEDPTPGGEGETTTAVDSGTDEPGTEAPKPGKKRGCKSSVGIGGAVALVMILGGAGTMAATRRKED